LIGYPYRATNSKVDETSVTHVNPAVDAMQTAYLKARAVTAQMQDVPNSEGIIIVAADTTVAINGQMLGKPTDTADAGRMLRALRGRTHTVHTGMALIDLTSGREIQDVNTATVTMRLYGKQEMAAYIASGDPMDKAGAYAIQHPGFQPVARLQGCFMTVMGLSVCHLIQVLGRLGVPPLADSTAVQDAHQGYTCPIYDNIAPRLQK
jgi:MAF protein